MGEKSFMIFTTCPDKNTAERIAKRLLKKKLVACVNIIPRIKSFFWWQGKIEESLEVLLMMKSRKKALSLIKEEILKIHPYTIPEIIYLKIEGGFEKYLKWIEEVVR